MKFYLFLGLFFIKSLTFCQVSGSFNIQSSAFSFHLNKQQGSYSKFIEYDEKKQELLRTVDKPYAALEIFNIKTHKLKHVIRIKSSQLGSFKKTANHAFWIHDLMTSQYLLLDLKGTIIKEPEYSNNLVYIYSSYNNFTPIIIYNNALYVTGRLMFKDQSNIDLSSLKRTGIIKKISLNGQNTFIGRPALLSQTNFYGNMNNYSITVNKNMLIVSPHFSDEIQIINLDNSSTKLIKLKTKYENLIKPLSKLKDAGEFTNQEGNEYFKNSYTNIGFVYDKYRDIYYRFVRYPFTKMGPMTCNILVFDKKFNFLFEEKIDQKKYNASQFFITELGLAIFNYEKYKSDDTKMIFDLFTLKK